jgi:hypothetical protein
MDTEQVITDFLHDLFDIVYGPVEPETSTEEE